jgi:predicted methyltransferase
MILKFYHTGYTSEEDGGSQVTTQKDPHATTVSKVNSVKPSKWKASK